MIAMTIEIIGRALWIDETHVDDEIAAGQSEADWDDAQCEYFRDHFPDVLQDIIERDRGIAIDTVIMCHPCMFNEEPQARDARWADIHAEQDEWYEASVSGLVFRPLEGKQ